MDGALILVRFVHFSAAMLLLGTASFAGFIVPAGLRQRYERLTRWTGIVLVGVLVLTGLAWFALEAGTAGNGWTDAASPSMWAALATGTDFGSVWIWHLALLAVLILALILPRNVRPWADLLGSIALLASLGLIGHAAMQSGALGWEHRISHMLHLIAAGFWVGCLAPLLVCLNAMRSHWWREDAAIMLSRFSGLGHIAVAVALLTGMLNTGLTLGHPPVDFSSPYQALLAAKIALVGIMLAIALANRYMLTPRLAQRGLVLGTALELGLGVVVIALVSAFATFDPV